MSSNNRKLKETEINYIINGIDRKYVLEIYRNLKNSIFSSKVKKKDLKIIRDNVIFYIKNKNTPRKLTEKELEEIADVIPVNNLYISTITRDNSKQIKEKIKQQLAQHTYVIAEDTVKEIKDIIYEKYLRSLAEPGDSVGIMGAMAYGHPLTQGNLDAFHSAGGKTENTESMSNIKELFTLSTKRQVNETITHFKNKNLTKEEIKIMGKILKGVSINDIVSRSETIDVFSNEDKYWYNNFETITDKKLPQYIKNFINNRGEEKIKFLRLHLNITLMYKYNILISDIIQVIEKNTESQFFENTVYCVSSPSYMGIIDIYGNKEYINYSVNKFIQEGAKLETCESVRIKKTLGQKKILNTDDSTVIFLKVIIESCLKYMNIRGIPNIKEIRIPKPIPMLTIFNESEVIDSLSLEKYSSSPYNIALEDFNKIWRIKIQKFYVDTVGIPIKKIIDLMESVKVVILDVDEENYNLVILLPEEREEMIYTEEGKIIKKYRKNKDEIYFDNKTNEFDSHNYGPKKLIENILSFEKDRLKNSIEKNIEKEEKLKFKLPDYSDIYKYSYYCYANIEGKNIIKNLINHPLVDYRYTYPNNVNEVNELFGIEAARFYLITRYNMNEDIKSINPAHPELLVDFQTATGKLISIKFTGVSKIRLGNSTIASAAFQQGLDIFAKAAAFGKKDKIRGISSCIVTGTTCMNGTGSNRIEEDQDYIKNKNNKFDIDVVENDRFKQSEVVGNCYSFGDLKLSKKTENENEDSKIESIFSEGKTYKEESEEDQLCPKEKIPDPPRMEIPYIILELFDNEVILFGDDETENYTNITEVEEIPVMEDMYAGDEDLDFKI